jgi:hypothetical protein
MPRKCPMSLPFNTTSKTAFVPDRRREADLPLRLPADEAAVDDKVNPRHE